MLIYINNTIIYSITPKDYLKHLQIVLYLLEQLGTILLLSKYYFI